MLENLIINMEKFTKIKSIPAYISLMNIDTDKIIPKQFLKTIKRSGLGKSLFYEMRFDEKGNPIKGFILDQEPFNSSKILITGKNFGCGSSREHAPWALLDFGIRVIISESFADIFYNNCFKNGILPIKLDQVKVDLLMKEAEEKKEISVNLEKQIIAYQNDKTIDFEIDEFRKKCLIEGLDDIGLTLKKNNKIDIHEEKIHSIQPWIV